MVWRIQALHEKQLKTTAGRKNVKSNGNVIFVFNNTSTTLKKTAGEKKGMGYIAPPTGYYPRNG